MKKKNYLQKMEQGALIGTSFLLLNGIVSCSKEPMDTPPAETFMTKSPVGPPGIGGMTYYAPGERPILQVQNQKSGFIMTDGYCSFGTTIPTGYSGINITMNENESFYTRKITKVEVGAAFLNFRWTKGSSLELSGFKDSHSQSKPAVDVGIKIYSVDKSPVVLYFQYTY